MYKKVQLTLLMQQVRRLQSTSHQISGCHLSNLWCVNLSFSLNSIFQKQTPGSKKNIYFLSCCDPSEAETTSSLILNCSSFEQSPEKADTFVMSHLIPELTKDKIDELVKMQHPKFILQCISDMVGHFPLKTK